MKKNKKRKIPYLKITSNIPYDVSVLISFPEFYNVLYRETLLAIKDGVNSKKNNVILFDIHGSDYQINLNKESWIPSLQSILKYHEGREEFEKCAECINLINQLNEN